MADAVQGFLEELIHRLLAPSRKPVAGLGRTKNVTWKHVLNLARQFARA